MADEDFEYFKSEFKDLCESLHGRFKEENNLGEMVCVLKGAVLYGRYGIPNKGDKTIFVKKRGKITVMVEGFERTTWTSKFLNPARRGVGCFISGVDGSVAICLNEEGQVVLAEVYNHRIE